MVMSFSGNIGTDFQEQEYVAGIWWDKNKLTWSESTKKHNLV
jgi:hypothetical protein